MARKAVLSVSLLLAGTLMLGGCNRSDSDQSLNALDDSLAGNVADPALADALESQIRVDPKLAGKGGGGATGSGAAPSAAETGTLLRAPAPQKAPACEGNCKPGTAGAQTLGALAGQQGTSGGCDAKLAYDNSWAARLPADLPLYPHARVSEAAGAAGTKCNIRTVTFTTAAKLQDVVDFYYTKAVRSGFSSEHLLDGTDHVLGGTRQRDNGAYYIMVRALKGGATEVDIVANNGR